MEKQIFSINFKISPQLKDYFLISDYQIDY